MEEEEKTIQSSILSFIRQNPLVIGLFSLGIIFVGIGIFQIAGTRETKIKFEKGVDIEGVSREAGSRSAGKIKIDVEGEVLKPGVYELGSDSRVQDALIAAGGLKPDANRSVINLAAKIADGQKIYIPSKGEVVSASNYNVISGGSAQEGSSIISINSSSESELDKLPSVGPVTAQKIIAGRPYSGIEELVSKKVIGQKTFEKIKDLISL